MTPAVDAVSNDPPPPLLPVLAIAVWSALCWAVVVLVVVALRAWVG